MSVTILRVDRDDVGLGNVVVLAFKRSGSLETFRARLERVAIGINLQFPEAL